MANRTTWLAMAAGLLLAPTAAAQIWSDNLDAYDEGMVLFGVNDWTGWNGHSNTAAVVTADQFRSPPHSALIDDLPNTPGGGVDAVVDWRDRNLFFGVYLFRCWVYVPEDFVGSSYFIMLNDFDGGGNGTVWTTQVHFDDTGEVVAEFNGETLPLRQGEWVSLIDLIDLGWNEHTFLYGEDVLYRDIWCRGLVCLPHLAVLDLFNNDSTAVYYDDLSLSEADEIRPHSFEVIFGRYADGTIEQTWGSDDGYLQIEQRAAVTPRLPVIRVDLIGTAVSRDVTTLIARAETSSTAVPGVPLQRLSLRDHDAAAWEVIDEHPAIVEDEIVDILLDDTPQRFINANSLETRLRLELFDPSNVIAPNWRLRIDQARLFAAP